MTQHAAHVPHPRPHAAISVPSLGRATPVGELWTAVRGVDASVRMGQGRTDVRSRRRDIGEVRRDLSAYAHGGSCAGASGNDKVYEDPVAALADIGEAERSCLSSELGRAASHSDVGPEVRFEPRTHDVGVGPVDTDVNS